MTVRLEASGPNRRAIAKAGQIIGTKESAGVEPIPDTGLSSPTPNVIESDDERAARRRGLMQAAAAESRAIMAADLAAVPRLSSYTGRDNAADDESPIAEEVAAQAYLRTSLLASAGLRQACETRRDQMLKTGASEDAVLDPLLGMVRAHSESLTSPSVPIGSFDSVMTAWERGEDRGMESADV